MDTAATQAEQTAMQARAVVAAFDGAFALTTPPPVIAANRSLQASLIATNFLGQNTGAIMATEALYMEMWAQCATAMYGYAASAGAAAQLAPFATPTQKDRKSTRLNSSHVAISYAVFCLKKKNKKDETR